MAITNVIITLSNTKTFIELGTSNSFKVQNIGDKEVRFAVTDSSISGGIIEAGDSTSFDYDIDMWCAFNNGYVPVYIIRD